MFVADISAKYQAVPSQHVSALYAIVLLSKVLLFIVLPEAYLKQLSCGWQAMPESVKHLQTRAPGLARLMPLNPAFLLLITPATAFGVGMSLKRGIMMCGAQTVKALSWSAFPPPSARSCNVGLTRSLVGSSMLCICKARGHVQKFFLGQSMVHLRPHPFILAASILITRLRSCLGDAASSTSPK